jgi:hypothetical protein
MKASAGKFVCILHEDRMRRGAWVAFLTWRLGHRGAYVVRARSESELRGKLRKLDPTVRFHQWRRLNPGGERKNEDASAN